LLTQLKEKGIATVSEVRDFPEEHYKVIILEGELPSFPHGRRKTWYPIVVMGEQEDIAEEEVEALPRHFWHGETEIGLI